MEWKEIFFDDFCRLNRGFDLPNDKVVEGDVPVVASSSVKAFHNVAKVKGPGVVTGRSGTLGVVQYLEKDFWPLNTSLYVKDFKGNSPRFCYYFLQMMHLENFNAGAGVPTLNQNHLHKLKIKVPSTCEEQEKVASILSNYDTLIDINAKRIKLLEDSARDLYKEWFVRMRFPGHEQAKFVRGIPEGWNYSRIDEFYKTGSGGTPSSSHKEYYEGGRINWIRTGELKDGFIFDTEIQITESGLQNSSAKIYPPHSVVLAMYGNTIGQLGITSKSSSTNQACCVLLPKTKDYCWEFLFLSLLEYRPYLISFGFGAAQQNISQDEIKKFKILIPENSIVKSFANIVTPLFKSIETLQLQTQSLTVTRDRLLPRLLSGELKINA